MTMVLSVSAEPTVHDSMVPELNPSAEEGKSIPNNATGMQAKKGKATPDLFPIEGLSTQCIFCMGQAELSLELRVNAFYSRGDLRRHCYRKHLRHYPDGEPIYCPHPKCEAVQ